MVNRDRPPLGRLSAEAADLRALTVRVLELERERAQARDRAALLLALQTACTRIAVTRSPQEIVATVLQAAFEPLGFRRGIYFGVDRERGIEARWQTDGHGGIEESRERPGLLPGSAILGMLRGGAGELSGRAGELSAPLVDVRGWYVMSALTHADKTVGILYLDGHESVREPRAWEMKLVRALTTIASVSIGNSILFAETHELATRDPLTGLFNRRAFAERLAAEIETCRRQAASLTYVMIDVDDFKRVNDSYGHAHGDAVLKKLAGVLLNNSRAGDVAARYAGDEFVVLLVNVDAALARALVARLSSGLRAGGLSCSLGAALFPRDAADAAGLLAAADRALYATKAAGKDGFSFV